MLRRFGVTAGLLAGAFALGIVVGHGRAAHAQGKGLPLRRPASAPAR